MATTRVKGLAISKAELDNIRALTEGADSVELKLTVPESEQRSAMAALGLDPIAARDPPGLFLRHARPRARPRGRRGACATVRGARPTTRS